VLFRSSGISQRPVQALYEQGVLAAKEKIFTQSVINGWTLDVELFTLAEKFNLKVIEIPVVWLNDKKTKVNLFKDVPKIIFELFKIYWLYLLKFDLILISNVFKHYSKRFLGKFFLYKPYPSYEEQKIEQK